MAQFAAEVGISHPYLSQIERGLRAPSDTVLSAIADALQTSSEQLWAESGFAAAETSETPEPPRTPTRLEAEISGAIEMTATQRRAMLEIYRGFVDANRVRRSRRPSQP